MKDNLEYNIINTVQPEYLNASDIRKDNFPIYPILRCFDKYYNKEIDRDLCLSKIYDYLWFNDLPEFKRKELKW